MRKIACAFLAVAALLTGVGSAQAASILVLQDSGNVGAFTFTNTGFVSGNTVAIMVAEQSSPSMMNTVNGAIITPEPVSVSSPVILLVTPVGGGQYTLHVTPNDPQKIIGGTLGQQARLNFNLTAGDTPASLPNFFNASGPVTSLVTNLNPLYDFSAFANGQGKINFTFTATSFTGTTNFAGLFATPGAVATGNASFSQIAGVPEPASVVMMGLGLMGVFTWYWPQFRASRAV